MYYYLIEIATISGLISICYKYYQRDNKKYNKKKREKRENNNLNYIQRDYITNKTKIDYSLSINELV